MTVGQLPDQVGEFARYLRELVGRLDQSTGWCGVFWHRDPDGMRACLEGTEVPPWDVVQALLHDLAADRGTPEDQRETDRARVLHRASLTAYDTRPGARDLLRARLDAMLGEQRLAMERQADLSRQLAEATGPEEADRVNLDLAWVRDDHERATARCVEIQERLARLDAAERSAWHAPGLSSGEDRASHLHGLRPGLRPEDAAARAHQGSPGPASGHDWGAAQVPSDDAQATDLPPGEEGIAQTLLRLRHEGRTGEAHAVLAEAAAWPAADLPPLAEELDRAGLAADWATLLWEAASLPPDRLVALADALAGAGRADDCRTLLRQGVTRPAPEIAEALLALIDAGREREARALLDSYVRVRTPEDAARCAHTDPERLVPLLLETARAVSEAHHWDLLHALRVAGFTA
ncbi:hypothetical protein [Streptomyces sp. NPDC005898]|uniref:hypothetical protein n=2 Tax=unclassified Streptomyces TaxID=2593676 RepID=UPI0033CD81AE